MSRLSAIGALTLAVVACLGAGQAHAMCDQFDDTTQTMAGPIRNISDVGVIMFVDTKTGCEVGLIERDIDKACRKGGQIQVTGQVMKNKYAPGTYSMNRGRKPAPGTLVCR